MERNMKQAARLYQLMPDKDLLMEGYVICTQNNKIIVIDGGHILEDRDYYIHSAIRAVLGLDDGAYFEIEAWILTHNHEDHLGELCLQLERYRKASNFTIKNIYFDFADLETAGYPTAEKDAMREHHLRFKKALDHYAHVCGISVQNGSYYDDLNGAVVNAKAIQDGLTLAVDNVQFTFLQTRSDADEVLNSSSLVFKMLVHDACGKIVQTVMFLGDTSRQSGERLLKNVPAKALQADIVQMAHHGNWCCDKSVYDTIGAKIKLWPTPIWVWEQRNPAFDLPQVREWVGTGKTADAYNLVACLYPEYPANRESVSDWKQVLPHTCLQLPYEVK